MIKPEVALIRDATAELCEPFHDAFAWAHQRQRKQLPELLSPQYGWLRTHLIRGLAHSRLCELGLGAWTLSGNHARNGELWLTGGDYRVRLLHGFRDDHVPAPGLNHERRAYYYNPRLPAVQQEPLSGPTHDKLLILWRIDQMGAPLFRVVRTTRPWAFGKMAEVDLDFPLLATAEDLRELRFEPQDEGLELQLPNEETLDADRAGGFPR
ncbi:hypothetical protein ACIOC1_01135 [Streptomyces sp. NPDC088197]|uniref:hypothetical protein n=1 Tax=Streptomyces sp. NPDC088197 TaxID=3365840 RepID=UPI0037F88AFD